jgi:diguanylate cyclase (GGDEF)-like protein
MTSRRDAASRQVKRPDPSWIEPEPAEPPPLSFSDLRERLAEAEETLRAIRNGEVDALVVSDASSPHAQVFTLSSADRPYRMFVENMHDGAATVSESGIVLYANRRLAQLLGRPLVQVIGAPIGSFIADAGHDIRVPADGTFEADLISGLAEKVRVRISTSTLDVEQHVVLCLTFADLTEENAHKLEIDRLQAERLRELEQAQDALTRLATHDALTGLANRTLLLDRIIQALASAERSKTSIGLIFVDLDGFKAINDTRGHAVGDTVLCRIADRLQRVVRPMDSVARLGGDEFVVLLPALAGSGDATAVAERLTAEINRPIKLDRGAVSVTASIGISVAEGVARGSDRTADWLLQEADTAMYHAKLLGGAHSQLFEEGTTPTVFEADRATWAARIREALEKDHFVLHGQPIVDLASGAIVQHELLLRLRDSDGQLIAPLAFLPTAERCGLIGAIDQWVIRQAVRIAAKTRVAVNLSAVSATDPFVLDLVEKELARHETDPANIIFEITETALMQNMDRGKQFAERVIALGCSLSLDDFGTGFASFTYLKRIPVQYLKIDIEFVRDVVDNEQDRSVVSAIVGLAHSFGQQTIAEGVENEETANVLRSLGVTFAQGYLFGRPGPLPD